MRVVPDGRSGVRGFEDHTFKCSACNGVEQNRVFMRYGRESDVEPIPAIPRPVLQQLHECKVSASPGLGFFWRVVAKIRPAGADQLTRSVPKPS